MSKNTQNIARKEIKNILIVPGAKFKGIMPESRLDVLFMDYIETRPYSRKASKWSQEVNPTPSEWNVTHKGGAKRSRRFENYYTAQIMYPSLFVKGTALGESGVRQVGNTLIISGQNPMDVTKAFITGEIPTKNGKKYIGIK